MRTKELSPWGHAIGLLLKQANCSRRKAARLKLASRSSFSRWNYSESGPRVYFMNRLLKGLGLTWMDWTRAIEATAANSRKT